ncbi:hypothetical protein Tco_0886823 [Tanacetum coccineum]
MMREKRLMSWSREGRGERDERKREKSRERGEEYERTTIHSLFLKYDMICARVERRKKKGRREANEVSSKMKCITHERNRRGERRGEKKNRERKREE